MGIQCLLATVKVRGIAQAAAASISRHQATYQGSAVLQASAGFPDHPHRGFETCSIMLSGEMEHYDSAGNHVSCVFLMAGYCFCWPFSVVVLGI